MGNAKPNHDACQSQLGTYKARTAYRNEAIAAEYDCRRFSSWRGRLGDRLDKRALSLALSHWSQDEGLILDIPCGTGRITSYMASTGYGVLASDISADMLTMTQGHLTDSAVAPLGYVQADAARLPFRSDTFLGATAIRFMGHIPAGTRIEILRELARVTRGYIVADYCVFSPIVHIRRRIEHLLKTRQLGFEQGWTWQSVPRHQLEREFRAADLEAVGWFAKMRFLSDAWMVLLASRNQESGES